MKEWDEEKAKREALRVLRAERAQEAGYPVGYAKTPEHTRFSGEKQPHRTKRPPAPRLTRLERFARIAREKVLVIIDGKRVMMEQEELIDRAGIQDAKKNPRARAEFHKRMDLADKSIREVEQTIIDYSEEIRAKIEKMASRREASEEEARKLAEAAQSPPKKPEDDKK